MTAKTYPAGRCCVFQPFDTGGPFDKRFDDTIAPAVEAAGLEPYRVDRDPSATILMDTLHNEIRTSTLCFADISSHNPNVMYELGYAIASGKDVVLISAVNAPKFPFDIQHRHVISYSLESKTDFEKLRNEVTEKLIAILKRQETTATITNSTQVKDTAGLKPHELTALALLMSSTDSSEECVSAFFFKRYMMEAGYTDLASRVAVRGLIEKGLAEQYVRRDDNEEPHGVYRITLEGETWLMENQDELELRIQKPESNVQSIITDDENPF